MTAMIFNNVIPVKNTSTKTILSLIPETYPEEAIGTTTEAAKVTIDGIMNTHQTTRTMTTIFQIPYKTSPKTSFKKISTRYNDQNHKSDNNRSDTSTKISNPNTGNKRTEILLQSIPKWFRQQLKNNRSNEVKIHAETEIWTQMNTQQ